MVARQRPFAIHFPVDYTLGNEVDERVSLRVDVVLVEKNFRVAQDFAQTPREGSDVVEKSLIRSQRVKREALRCVRREVRDVLERTRFYAHLLVERAIGVFQTHRRLIEIAEVGPLHVEADRGNRSLALRKVREYRRYQPLDRARFRREPRHARDVQVGRFRAEQEISVEVDHRISCARAVHADGNAGVRAFLEIAVHPERDRNILFGGQENLAHRDRLQRLVGNLPQNRRSVEADLRSLGAGQPRVRGRSVMSENVVHRGPKIRVAEPFDDDTVDVRNTPVKRMRSVYADDSTDANRTIERSPEMKLVRSVRLPLSCDDTTEWSSHEIARRNSSASLIPYAILSHLPSGRASGAPSARIHRDISSAFAEISSERADSTRTRPNSASRPAALRMRRYQLATGYLEFGATRNADVRSPGFNPTRTRNASPSA